jgi:hypothetical protein
MTSYSISEIAATFVLIAGSMALAVAGAPDEPPVLDPAEECTVAVAPAVVMAQTEPVEVQAQLSGLAGRVVSVTVEAGSGLYVVGFDPTDEATVSVTLDTSDAVEGAWQLVFVGEENSCTGVIEVEGQASSFSS